MAIQNPTTAETIARLKTDPEFRAWVRSEAPKARARSRHLEFVKHTWQRPDPFLIGRHTIGICSTINQAFARYKKGESSFYVVTCCFRHGKSDLGSRYLPAHFLGEFPNDEVILTSHSDTKAQEFSKFGRTLIRSDEYKELYPNVCLAADNQGVEEWGLENGLGKAQFFGIGSGSAGKGGNLIIIDDYFSKREHAESDKLRDKTWISFTDDFLTRRAPVSIVLVLVTPWHVDDIVGRIKKHMKEDERFPKFEFVSYPAFSDSYESGTLFPERFSKAWYETQSATLGTYGTASLMQCDPQVKGGNRIRTDKIHVVAPDGACSCGSYHEWPKNLDYVRAWDLASSEKQTEKQDPDFTVGAKLAVVQLPTAIPDVFSHQIWIDDVVRGQWLAPRRNQTIIDTTMADGYIQCGIEGFGAYKDAYETIDKILTGLRVIRKMNLPGDKIAKASPLEPIFEAGNVYMRQAPWNDAVIKVISDFPGGAHDDDVDAIDVGYYMCTENASPFIYTTADLERETKKENGEGDGAVYNY